MEFTKCDAVHFRSQSHKASGTITPKSSKKEDIFLNYLIYFTISVLKRNKFQLRRI